ncbi:MAG: hypothetical protein ACE5EA_10425 [Nitrospirota bacterium]
MSIFEFTKEVIEVCAQSEIVKKVQIIIVEEPVAKLRAEITDNIFIDIFYNKETAKKSFSLIKDNKRIYGADNTKEWHIHPFNNPESHQSSNEIGFVEFIEKIKDYRYFFS